MTKPLLTVLPVLFTILSKPAFSEHHYDVCDTFIDSEKGEKHGGPFFGLGILMTLHHASEKYCDNKPIPLEKILVSTLRKEGCAPEDELFKKLIKDGRRVEATPLADTAHGGTPAQRKGYVNWIEEFGGCKTLENIDWISEALKR